MGKGSGLGWVERHVQVCMGPGGNSPGPFNDGLLNCGMSILLRKNQKVKNEKEKPLGLPDKLL